MSQNAPRGRAVLKRLDGTIIRTDAPNRREAVLERIKLSPVMHGFDLRGVDLSGADLGHANFEGSDLTGADLTGTKGRHLRFDKCDLSGMRAIGAVWANPSFRQAKAGTVDGKGTSFRGAKLRGADWEGAKVDGADFADAVMEGAKLVSSAFSNTSFARADLRNCEHRGARYDRNDFAGTDLTVRRPTMWGVERRTYTEGVRAVGNKYDKATVTSGTVPAFEEERNRSFLTGIGSGLASTGLGIAAGTAASFALEKTIDLDWAGACHWLAGTVGGARAAASEFVASHIGEGMSSFLSHAATLVPREAVAAVGHGVSHAALMAGHAIPHVPMAPHLLGIAVGIVVAHAAPMAVHWTSEKVRDAAKAFVGPSMGRLFDRLGDMMKSAARRHGGFKDVVMAMANEGVDRGMLRRALSATAPEPAPGAEGAPFEAESDGSVTLVVCKMDHLQAALEAIANSWQARKGPGRDVILVRSATRGSEEPVALKFHARGGMTAFWTGPEGVRQESWTAGELLPLMVGKDDRASEVRRAFENAILRDHAPSLPFEFDARDGRVTFRHDDGGFRVTRDREGDFLVHQEDITEPEMLEDFTYR